MAKVASNSCARVSSWWSISAMVSSPLRLGRITTCRFPVTRRTSAGFSDITPLITRRMACWSCCSSTAGESWQYFLPYPAAYLLRGAGYKISPPPPGGQVGYGIVLFFSRLRSPFGVEFGFTHYWGYVMMWQINRDF